MLPQLRRPPWYPHGRGADERWLGIVATVSDRATRYGMILLDEGPSILRSRGEPIVFRSPEETLEYARLHGIQRWMVYGDREGWWPIYTPNGPVNPPPPPKERVDISLH
jgi:hypothetical protein